MLVLIQSDGKFFVAKKGIFNKNPKVYKTNKDIDDDIAKGDLNIKMKLALKNFPALNIKGVIQGDFLYAKKDIKKANIGGESYITFHPNTIVYAIPAKSKLASQILRSEIGVVWHTEYRGKSFESMSASFGKEIASNLKKSTGVWSVDAMYKDVSGECHYDAEQRQMQSQNCAITSGQDNSTRLIRRLPSRESQRIAELLTASQDVRKREGTSG